MPKPQSVFSVKASLVLARQQRMAASEDHPQLAVFDRRVEKQLIDALPSGWGAWRPISRSHGAESRCAQRVENLVPGDAMDPAGRVVRNAASAPRLQASTSVAWTISSTRSKFRQPKKRVSTETSRPASRRKKCSTSGATGSGCVVDMVAHGRRAEAHSSARCSASGLATSPARARTSTLTAGEQFRAALGELGGGVDGVGLTIE